MKSRFSVFHRALVVAAILGAPTITGSTAQAPALAGGGPVFDLHIIACGPAGAADGCGSNSPATDPLTDGNVRVDNDGDVRVELRGAAPNTTYTVFVGNWATGAVFQIQFIGTGPAFCGGVNTSIGTVTTDGRGNFHGPITTPSGSNFAFPSGTSIGQPNFAFNNPPCPKTQFTTGFTIH